MTETWVHDGLLLLGDAAHVASPVGGQGNGLAVQDAVVAHSTIVHALEADEGAIPSERLRRFESIRRPAVEEVLSLQRRGERVVSWYVRHGDSIPPWLVKPLARAAFAVAPQTPLVRQGWKTFALGPKPVSVETTAFRS